MSYDNCGLGQMVFGGHGYVREWGQEQLVRDVRIAQIYEGTNGIQSLDLLGRKVVANKADFYQTYSAEINTFILAHENNGSLANFIKPLRSSLTKLNSITDIIMAKSQYDRDLVGASATDYLAIFGYVSYAYMWALMAEKSIDKTESDDFYQAKLYVGEFYLTRLLPRIDAHIQAITAGSKPLMAMPADLFS